MPRSFALAAAMVTVLSVTACGTAAQTAQQADEPATAGPQTADSGADSGQPAAPGQSEALGQPAAPGQSEASGQPQESGLESSDAAPMSDGEQLRTGTLDAALRASPGEPGLPAGSGASIDDVLRLGAVATWVDAPRVLAISLPASDDCWPSAGTPMAMSDSQITVAFAAAEACLQPDAARTYTFEVPEGIDAAQPLEIRIEGLQYRFTLTLPAT